MPSSSNGAVHVFVVTGGEKDYSSKFSLGVFRGRLALLNRTPGGMVLYVR